MKSLKILLIALGALGLVIFSLIGSGERVKQVLFPGESARSPFPFSLTLDDIKVVTYPQSREIQVLEARTTVQRLEGKESLKLTQGDVTTRDGWQIRLGSWEARGDGVRGAVIIFSISPFSWLVYLSGGLILSGLLLLALKRRFL